MDSTTAWQERDPERFEEAHKLLMMEQPRERVVSQIMLTGLSETDASELVDEAWNSGRGDRRSEGRSDIAWGVAKIVGGLLAALILWSAFSWNGYRLVYFGLILYGIFDIIQGARKLLT